MNRLSFIVPFVGVFIVHAFYVGISVASPVYDWSDSGFGNQAATLNLGVYCQGQYYFIGFSYALTAAFAVWAFRRSILSSRNRILTAGAATAGVTFCGALMAGGCFLTGCCGSPMMAVYLCLFGVKASFIGKPLAAMVTLFSVSCGYWCLSRCSAVPENGRCPSGARQEENRALSACWEDCQFRRKRPWDSVFVRRKGSFQF
jgi:hypothetical protein